LSELNNDDDDDDDDDQYLFNCLIDLCDIIADNEVGVHWWTDYSW